MKLTISGWPSLTAFVLAHTVMSNAFEVALFLIL